MMYLKLWKVIPDNVVSELKVDGGASANDFLMEFQSDILEYASIRKHQNA